MCVYIYIYIYIYVYIHVYIYIYICIHAYIQFIPRVVLIQSFADATRSPTLCCAAVDPQTESQQTENLSLSLSLSLSLYMYTYIYIYIYIYESVCAHAAHSVRRVREPYWGMTLSTVHPSLHTYAQSPY